MIYPRLHLDKETRSAKELGKSSKNVGLYRYALDPTTSVWMFSYRFEYAPGVYGPIKRWWRDQPLPDEVITHIALGLPVLGHNVTFERTIWNVTLRRQLGIDLPVVSIGQTDCTMARVCAIGLPGDLERAARVVNAPVQKDTVGAETMLKMAKPRSIVFSSEAAGRAYYAGDWIEQTFDSFTESRYCVGYTGSMTVTWWYDTTLRNTLSLYCDDDVGAECGVDQVVPALSPAERAVWELDQRINDRGVMIDKTLCSRIITLVGMGIGLANREMWTLTGGKVKKCSDHGAVRRWLVSRGIECDSVAKDETDGLVLRSKDRGDKDAQRVVELHTAAAKARTEKFKKALEVIGEDDRARGQFSYHVANATGRWGARGIQLQNLMRVDEERDLPTVMRLVDLILTFEPAEAFQLIGAL